MPQEAISKFKTSIVNLHDLDAYRFIIPTYQRPYVWGDEELKKLLDDFYTSFKTNATSPYYISTILIKEIVKDKVVVAEVIDGQQRFTTLWLIAFEVSQVYPDSKLASFLKNEEKLRLGFEIRQEVTEFLNDLLTEEKVATKIYDQTYIESYPYLKNIAKALVFINSYIEQEKIQKDLEALSDFIYEKVYFIKNTTPANTDLNKLFSTINSSGVQLEQTDIIKANLLNLIDEKVMYGKIWEACENMNNFFERNARASFPKSNWKSIYLDKCTSFDQNIFKYEREETNGSTTNSFFSIDSLTLNNIPAYNSLKKQNFSEEDRESEEIYCRSIINFGQLLLHTYRIHLKVEGKPDFQGTFHTNRLIEIFKELEERKDSNEIKRFFLLLWEVRYLFDRYIIKWVSDINNKVESLELVNINRNNDGHYSRSNYKRSASLMLQSVLYFTGDYLRQYWISAYLEYLYFNHNDYAATNEDHLNYLEKIDNTFSLDQTNTDKELSWSMMHQNFKLEKKLKIEDYLLSHKGTGFKHYWFQKLEYILWKNWKDENIETDSFLNYRITSRNSIEHIYPQNPENVVQYPKLDEKYLHSFGNLALLSVAQNSEYSNKAVRVKRSMFKVKRETYDSLKSYYIFKSDKEWDIKQIEDHEVNMINKILKHYKMKTISIIK